jgi:predicted component of type VI protein secretion system
MYNFGVGGNEVKKDASESIADIPMNRTLFVQKLTDDAPIKPEAVYDLKTVEEVFEHFKPSVDVEFETTDGSTVQENISFKNLGDFNAKNITENSKFLKDLQLQQDQYQNIIKQLKTNKLLKSVVENPDNKNAFVDVLKALIQELEDHSK